MYMWHNALPSSMGCILVERLRPLMMAHLNKYKRNKNINVDWCLLDEKIMNVFSCKLVYNWNVHGYVAGWNFSHWPTQMWLMTNKKHYNPQVGPWTLYIFSFIHNWNYLLEICIHSIDLHWITLNFSQTNGLSIAIKG